MQLQKKTAPELVNTQAQGAVIYCYSKFKNLLQKA